MNNYEGKDLIYTRTYIYIYIYHRKTCRLRCSVLLLIVPFVFRISVNVYPKSDSDVVAHLNSQTMAVRTPNIQKNCLFIVAFFVSLSIWIVSFSFFLFISTYCFFLFLRLLVVPSFFLCYLSLWMFVLYFLSFFLSFFLSSFLSFFLFSFFLHFSL